jgi:hypothetical protein
MTEKFPHLPKEFYYAILPGKHLKKGGAINEFDHCSCR